MLETLTFTGVDAQTSMESLAEIARQYPKTEFGVLVGDRTGKPGAHIFPPMDVANRLKEAGQEHGFQTAIHLCGAFTRWAINRGHQSRELPGLLEGFDRVQINLHQDSFTPKVNYTELGSAARRVVEFAENISPQRTILQHRVSWTKIPIDHEKIEYLYDQSEGRGIDGIDAWPPPSPDLPRMGYAGGVGPATIEKAMDFVHRHSDSRLWLDMEGRIRTQDGFLDLQAVTEVCEKAFPPPQDYS